MMKNVVGRLFLVAAITAGFAGAVRAANVTNWVMTRVVNGGECSLAADSNSGQNVLPTTTLMSQVFYEGNGTLKLTGSGAEADVYTTLVATNGTLTIDASGFTFTGETKKLVLKGGIFCDTTGKLTVSGLDAVVVGTQDVNMPASLKNVELNGATLDFDKVSAWVLPDRNAIPWTINTNAHIHLIGTDVLHDLAEDHVIRWGNAQVGLYGDDAIADGDTLVSTYANTKPRANGAVYYASGYAPTWTWKNDGNVYTQYNAMWGQSKVQHGNVRMGSEQSVKLTVRYAKVYGQVEADYLVPSGSAAASAAGAFDFFGPVDVKTEVYFNSSGGAGQWVRFFNVCFTNGVSLTFTDSNGLNGTNNTLFLDKKVDLDYVPNFTTVRFAQGQPVYNHHSALVVSNLTAKIGAVTAGAGVLRGNGTVKLGGITGSAKLMVEPGITVVKDPDVAGSFCSRVDADRLSGKTYTTYFAANGADGALDLNTYAGTETVKACDGLSVYGSTNGFPTAAVDPAGNTITLHTLGETWKDNAKIDRWYDFSDFSTMTQVVATVDPPTSTGHAGNEVLTADQCGPKDVVPSVPVKNVSYPAIESVIDKRGPAFGSRLYNNRMYQNLESTGTNEWWENVYVGYVTNDGARAYMSSGPKSSSRRILFPTQPALKSVTLVFGAQNGGGAALLALSDGGKALGREKGLTNPIASNDVCRICVNGREVVPSQTLFSNGWQVVTIQCTNSANYKIIGLGFSTAYTGAKSDAGGQNYGEMIIRSSLPTEDERIAMEQYLAEKWGIPYEGHPTAKVTLTGTGTANVSGDYAIAGDFTGTNVLSGNAEVTLTTTGSPYLKGQGAVYVPTRVNVPQFDPQFQGTVQLGAGAWDFTINPSAGVVENPIDIGQAQFVIPEAEVPVTLRIEGKLGGSTQPFTLVRGCCFTGTPSWSAALLPEKYASKSGKVAFTQTATELRVRLPSVGFFLLFR